MIFRKTLRGKLISINEITNNKHQYTIQEENGKKHTINFEKHAVGTCKIDDEVYIAYNNTPFKKNKTGLWLTNNIYLANKKVTSPYFKYTQPFMYRFLFPFLAMFSLQFTLTLYNILPYTGIFLLTFLGFFIIQYFLGQVIEKNINRFIVEKPIKVFFSNYFNNNFSFIEKTVNKKLTSIEKENLRVSINRLDISSTLKLEYMNLIDNNELTITDIKKIEYYRQKHHIVGMSDVNYN